MPIRRRRSTPGARRGNRSIHSRHLRDLPPNRLKSTVQAGFSAPRSGYPMRFARRFAVAALTILSLAPVRAAELAHDCLDQKERRAEIESGRVVRLDAAMQAARSKMPGTLVRARLCHGNDGLVYVLTVLARDGKVARLTVDAVKGSLVGGLLAENFTGAFLFSPFLWW